MIRRWVGRRGPLVRTGFVMPEAIARKGGGARGEVASWSPASKLRFMLALCGWVTAMGNAAERLHFATLTLGPDHTAISDEQFKSRLAAYNKWLKRQDIHGIWCLEFQRRGALHIHMILWAPDWNGKPAAMRKRWIDLFIDTGATLNGQQVVPCRNPWQVATYMAGEIQGSKRYQHGQGKKVGRRWGRINQNAVLELERKCPEQFQWDKHSAWREWMSCWWSAFHTARKRWDAAIRCAEGYGHMGWCVDHDQAAQTMPTCTARGDPGDGLEVAIYRFPNGIEATWSITEKQVDMMLFTP